MINCPNCKHQEIDGAIFCSECGAQLVGYAVETQKFGTSTKLEDKIDFPSATRTKEGGAWLSLHLVDSGQILPVADRKEVSLGRVSADQPIEPDIDLSRFKAFENGVSRLHAVIRYNDGNIVILDLGSSNGTYINGIKAIPNIETRIRHGDIVALGKLKMQIVLS